MLLALGPLQLDTTARTAVVGLADSLGPGCIERATLGADLVWLRHPAGATDVTEAAERSGLPIGVTVAAASALADLVAAGAIAVELASGELDAADLAAHEGIALWCDPSTARGAREAGWAGHGLVVEGGSGPDDVVRGTTVAGDGPAAWGAVVRAVIAGAAIVRTTDPRSVRRVVTVTDRLVAARAGGTS